MVVLNECVELQEPSNLVTRDDSQVSMHLQQHHFGGAGSVPSPTTTLNHHMVGSLGRKINNNGSTVGRSHRLSSFRPLHGQHADLIRECIEERMTAGPTYETIDPHHLSHFGYSTDYCTVSGSGCSSGSSIGRNNAGCIETILPDARCYATAGRGHTGRATDYQPVNPHHNPIYCSNTKQLDKSDGFGVLSAIFAIISLMSYVIDIGTDLSVCYFLYGINDRFSLGLTFAITIIPSITVNIFSLKWLIHDHRKDRIESIRRPQIGVMGWMVRILVHLLLLGPVLRYLELLWYGLESRSENKRNEKQEQREWQMNALPVLSTLQRTNHTESQTHVTNEPQIDYYLLAIHEDRDTALLSLLKSFIQCAPQMVLQIYLLAKSKPDFNLSKEYVQMAAIISSLFEMSWSMASYNRALRRSTPNKLNVSRMATITHFLWRFCTIGSRVLAIALFTSEYSYWVCPVAIGHWGIMTIWIMHQQTRFCDSERGDQRPCHEYVFNMIVGAIYLFCFLNVKDEPTRYKYLSFYTIVFSENISFIILWYVRSDAMNWYHTPALATVLGAFGVGMLLMLIYYWFLHPNGRPLWVNRAARCC